jgi:hypothetical protein
MGEEAKYEMLTCQTNVGVIYDIFDEEGYVVAHVYDKPLAKRIRDLLNGEVPKKLPTDDTRRNTVGETDW